MGVYQPSINSKTVMRASAWVWKTAAVEQLAFEIGEKALALITFRHLVQKRHRYQDSRSLARPESLVGCLFAMIRSARSAPEDSFGTAIGPARLNKLGRLRQVLRGDN